MALTQLRHPGAGRDPLPSGALIAWIPRSDVSAFAGIAYMDVGKGRKLGAEA